MHIAILALALPSATKGRGPWLSHPPGREEATAGSSQATLGPSTPGGRDLTRVKFQAIISSFD